MCFATHISTNNNKQFWHFLKNGKILKNGGYNIIQILIMLRRWTYNECNENSPISVLFINRILKRINCLYKTVQGKVKFYPISV